ncbi:FprA family A-type flavoprotein [Slackia heliotrinireducens]|uniref:FprA family A-type flavoprotein n=1 Tax=Slackia heliotrinireducens TaxID=84110 RepID=UPI003314DBF0
MHITQDIAYIGVNDHDIDLFEGQYDVSENGMAYNSYVILDESVAVMDTVDRNFTEQWLANLDAALDGRTPDYLVVHHMEPDHSSNIAVFAEKYPEARIVASPNAFKMMENYFGSGFVADRRMPVKEGAVLELGSHTLQFIGAPLVHWPEVMFSYDAKDKALFSADAFGKFGALDVDEDWACEARRYYFGIVGAFGAQVQKALGKVGGLDLDIICPLHGPVLSENLGYYLDLYNTWSSYGVESDGVAICYTSVYGHTKQAVEELARMLVEKGCPKVAVSDLARDDMAEAVEDAFRYGKVVLATTTYNNGIFPFMAQFIETLAEHKFQNRTIGLIEAGTWAPKAAKGMQDRLAACANIAYANTTVTIKGSLDEASRAQLELLADELCGIESDPQLKVDAVTQPTAHVAPDPEPVPGVRVQER